MDLIRFFLVLGVLIIVHEFGHFLGWDEADLLDRGLE